MNVFQTASPGSMFRTQDGHIAHITHVIQGDRGGNVTNRLAGTVEGLPHSEIWNEIGEAFDHNANLNLVGDVIEKRE